MNDERREVIQYLRDRIAPGEFQFVKATHVVDETSLGGTKAGEWLAVLAGRDLYGYPVAPTPCFQIELWNENNNGRVWRIERPTAYPALFPLLGPGSVDGERQATGGNGQVRCSVCGGLAVIRSTTPEGSETVENYRCRGSCGSGGHRVRDDEETVRTGGPVFTGRENHGARLRRRREGGVEA